MERRLYRSKNVKMLGGVAGGIAEYFDIDPVLIRIAFIVLIFQHGIGVLAYIILWIIVPKSPVEVAVSGAGATAVSPPAAVASPEEIEARKTRRAMIAGYGCIAFGALFLADNLLPGFDVWDLWPLILIGIGAGILWRSTNTAPTNTESLS